MTAKQACIVLFHCTTRERARTILRDGFVDRSGSYGFEDHAGKPIELRGVWLSDRPLDPQDFGGLHEDTVLRVVLDTTPADIRDYEAVDLSGAKSYREWCIPADYLRQHATIELEPDEDDEP